MDVPGDAVGHGARPDQDGQVRIKAMPAGSYYAIAVDYLPQGEWNNPRPSSG